MRVRHLNEFEAQGLLDREKSGLLDPKDQELLEHAEACDTCRDNLNEYGQLYKQLVRQPRARLAPGFAKRVLAALPQLPVPMFINPLAGVAGLAVMLISCVVMLLTLVPWVALAAALTTWSVEGFFTLKGVVRSAVSLAQVGSAWLSSFLSVVSLDWSVLRRLQESLSENPTTIGLLIAAALAVLVMSKLDSLLLVPTRQRRTG